MKSIRMKNHCVFDSKKPIAYYNFTLIANWLTWY